MVDGTYEDCFAADGMPERSDLTKVALCLYMQQL